ncbi:MULTISPECIES: DUF4913 domain-containing protein [Streptomyces]
MTCCCPVYGREVTSSSPWCQQWAHHPEAVARLHALWLAWQQYTDAEAGLAGPCGAATTSTLPCSSCARRKVPSVPAPPAPPAHHRLLASPAPASEGEVA